RGDGEPHRRGADAVQRVGAGIQHRPQPIPDGGDGRDVREPLRGEGLLQGARRRGDGAASPLLRPPMRSTGARLLALGLLLACATARAETPIPPAPERWVTDRAAFLSPATVADLDARLGDYDRRTGHQLLVYVDRTTGWSSSSSATTSACGSRSATGWRTKSPTSSPRGSSTMRWSPASGRATPTARSAAASARSWRRSARRPVASPRRHITRPGSWSAAGSCCCSSSSWCSPTPDWPGCS